MASENFASHPAASGLRGRSGFSGIGCCGVLHFSSVDLRRGRAYVLRSGQDLTAFHRRRKMLVEPVPDSSSASRSARGSSMPNPHSTFWPDRNGTPMCWRPSNGVMNVGGDTTKPPAPQRSENQRLSAQVRKDGEPFALCGGTKSLIQTHEFMLGWMSVRPDKSGCQLQGVCGP